MANIIPAPERALEVLLEVYRRRPDLQEVYPEAQHGGFGRLIDWAAGASTPRGMDSDVITLVPHAEWYEQHFTGGAAPVPWGAIRWTSAGSANPMDVTISEIGSDRAGAISQHLVTLLFLVLEFGLRQVVELGTCDGCSTIALLKAVHKIDGYVLSIDVEPCLGTRQRVAQAKLDSRWTFVQSDDLQVTASQLPHPVDLLFIDTNHTYAHTLAELQTYNARLRRGSWIGPSRLCLVRGGEPRCARVCGVPAR